jgi:hypothetical protein
MPELKSVETSRWRDADIDVRYVIFGRFGIQFSPFVLIVPYAVGQLFLR